MYYDPGEIEPALCCSFCQRRFSGVVKLIPECGNSICGECYAFLESELENLPAQYTCKACGEKDHLFSTRGFANNKTLMDLAKKEPIERPLSEQAKKLRELVGRVDEEIKRLDAFDPELYIREQFGQLEDEEAFAAEAAVNHINTIESDLHSQINGLRQEFLVSLKKRLSAQQEKSEQ